MTDQHIIQTIAHTIHVSEKQIQTALSLLQSGNTIPFIARYRKEATGMLNEIQLRQIQEQYEYEQALSSRREAVRQSIMEQGQWTEELGRLLDQAGKLQEIEDLYMPYKPKKRTKASIARDAGLEPLADIFWQQDPHGPSPEEAAESYLNTDNRRRHCRRGQYFSGTHVRACAVPSVSPPRLVENVKAGMYPISRRGRSQGHADL